MAEYHPTKSSLRLSKAGRLWLLSAVVSLFVMSGLLTLVDPSIWKARVAAVRPELLAAAAALICLTLWTRARRLKLLLPMQATGQPRRLPTYLRPTAWHHAAVVLLPSGLGDAILPFVAKQMLSRSLVDAVAALCVMRCQDLLVLLVLCLWGLGDRFTAGSGTSLTLVAVIGLLTAVLVRVDIALCGACRVGQQILGRLKRHWAASLQSHLQFFTQTAGWADTLRDRRRQLALAGWSIATWLSACTALWLVLAAYGIRLGVTDTALLLAGMNIVGIFAFFSIAGFGIAEGGFAGLLMLIGWPLSEASALALVVRPTLTVLNVLVPLLIESVARVLGGRLLKPRLKTKAVSDQMETPTS
jgi:uncharacterized membrane protein YbhN (UPF0104 family)